MQGGKSTSAVGSVKEAAANVGASAWSGKEKTKAVVQEKVAKMRASDPAEKAAADARMHERVLEVEAEKQDAMRHNAAPAAHHPTPAAPPPPPHAGAAVAARDRSALGATGGHDVVPGAAPTTVSEGADVLARTDGAVSRDGNGGGYTAASGTAGGLYT